MIDLVKRLREGAAGDIALCRTAADEIERQREALRIVQAALEAALNQVRDAERERDEARATKDMHKERQEEYLARADALSRQVAALRGRLDHLLQEWLAWNPGITGLARTRAEAILIDTAAAVAAYDRARRVEGAEAMEGHLDDYDRACAAGVPFLNRMTPDAVVDAKWPPEGGTET